MICSVCKREIKPGEYLVKCTKCGKIYHSSCWVKNKGCDTPNCHGTPTKQFKGNVKAEVDNFAKLNTTGSRYNPQGLKINRCPVCHKIILNGDKTYSCHICGTEYHQACWDKVGKCVLNCAERTAIQTGTASDKICPYCMMPIMDGEDIVVCPKCSIPHHKDCWNENGGCTTYGCDAKAEDVFSPSPRNIGPGTQIGNMTVTDISGYTCPFCLTEIHPTDRVFYCKKCGIPHHESCWIDNGGCTTYGCNSKDYSLTPFTGGFQSSPPPSYEPSQNLPPVIHTGYNSNQRSNYPDPPEQNSCGNNCWNGCIGFIIFILIMFVLGGGCSMF